MNSKILLLVYAGCAVGCCVSRLTDLSMLSAICKPLLMPVLMLFFWLNSKTVASKIRTLIMVALFFSWGGDVLLMFESKAPLFFLLGLVSFLLAHIGYILAFNQVSSKPKSILLKKPYLLIPFLLYAGGMMYSMSSNLGEMFVPVLVYASVISLMCIFAINRFDRVNLGSFWWVLAGAIIFVLSDSTIAINKFLSPFYYAGFVIMSLYTIGQFMIVKGVLMEGSERN